MTDKKFTDEEIIKALECCIKSETLEDCLKSKCPFSKECDLINRQKAEYENLDTKLKAMRGAANSYKAENERLNEIIKNCHKEILQKCDSCNNRIKTEAYKEFAERLKKETLSDRGYDILQQGTIDNILKEMVGKEE